LKSEANAFIVDASIMDLLTPGSDTLIDPTNLTASSTIGVVVFTGARMEVVVEVVVVAFTIEPISPLPVAILGFGTTIASHPPLGFGIVPSGQTCASGQKVPPAI
jgi:hypothetical protein